MTTSYKSVLLTEEALPSSPSSQNVYREVGQPVKDVLDQFHKHQAKCIYESKGVSHTRHAANLALADAVTVPLFNMVKYWQQFGMLTHAEMGKITDIIIRNTAMEYQEDFDPYLDDDE